jgi:hypothetical protein
MLVVYLSKTFGRKIMRDTAVLHDPDLFLSHFKGFYVTTGKLTQPGEGGFAEVNLLEAQTFLAIYYHNDLSEQLMFPFYINNYCARAGLYEHRYDEAPPETAIRYLNQEKDDTVLYVQGLSGVYSKLTIPGLDRYKDSSVVLNSARLEIPYHPDPMGNIMRKPSLLALKVKMGDSIYVDVLDRQVPEFYDGIYYEDDNLYVINFTGQVQRYLLGRNDNKDFYLMVDYPSFDMERVVLNAWDNSEAMRLVLIYTEL